MTDDPDELAALVVDYMTATGCSEDYAASVVGMAAAAASLDAVEKLPKLLPTIADPTFPPAVAVTVLAGLHKLEQSANGREILVHVGMRTIRRYGVPADLGELFVRVIRYAIALGRQKTAGTN